MTHARTGSRASGRRVLTPASLVSAIVAAGCLALAVVVAACGPSNPSGSTSLAPSAAGSPDSSAAARPTPWPGNAVLGIEALGAADGQIGAATTDLSRGIADENLSLMREAADGLAGVDVLLPNMDKIRLNPTMVAFADKYEAAIRAISDGGKRLRTAIDGGDAPGIATSTQDLLNGLKLYAAVQPELAAWIQQMPEQKRLLTQ
jgi:hypothetical protein